MEADLHLIGAMDALPGAEFSDAALEAELQRRGLNPADATLLREQGLLLALLVRTPSGQLARGPEEVRRERAPVAPPAAS